MRQTNSVISLGQAIAVFLALLIGACAFPCFMLFRLHLLRTSLTNGNVAGAVRALRLGAEPDADYNVSYNNRGRSDEEKVGETCLIRALKLDLPKAEPIVREMLRRGRTPIPPTTTPQGRTPGIPLST